MSKRKKLKARKPASRFALDVAENRTYDARYLLRCFKYQKEAIETARRKAEAGLPAGQRLSFNDFVLEAAIEKARALGVVVKIPKPPKANPGK